MCLKWSWVCWRIWDNLLVRGNFGVCRWFGNFVGRLFVVFWLGSTEIGLFGQVEPKQD